MQTVGKNNINSAYHVSPISWEEIENAEYDIKSICQLFEENAEREPEQVALIYKNKVITYKELNEQANQLARFIRKKYRATHHTDLTMNTPIPISVGRSSDFVIGILAILKAGGAYVPINPDYPTQRIELILEDIDSPFVLVEEYSSAKLKAICPDLPQIAINDTSYLQEKTTYVNVQTSANDLAYVIYTSGSTGKPKGVLAQHANVLAQVICANYFKADKTDTITFFSDVSFDSTTFEIWGALLNGASLFIPDNLLDLLSNPALFKQTVKENNITVVLLTRSLFDLLYTLDETVFASLQYLLVGGEALTKNLMLKLLHSTYKPLHVVNAYGPTENSTFCTTHELSFDFSHLHSVPIGRPYSNRVGVVLDRHHQLLPIGVVGELYVGGPSLARGYLNRPDLTAERFIANPFANKIPWPQARIYKTSDMIKWLPDGNLEYSGRNDFQVKLRGYRIELGEIETRLLELPAIKHSIVLLKQNEKTAFLVAYYVADNKIAESDLREHLHSLLPEYMVPSVFIYLKTLPVTTNGKLDRKALPEPIFDNQQEVEGSPIEKKIYGIWSNILSIQGFGRDESFFNLGGNSLSAMRARSELEKEFNLPLNIVELFQYTSLRQLAERISFLLSKNEERPNDASLSAISALKTSSIMDEPIAIVGIACRLPGGVTDPDSFWELLIQERSNLREFSADELAKNDLNEETITNSAYVKRGAQFESKFSFDAEFFGVSAKDAEIIDPQQRYFLECAWEALEHSGNVPEKFAGDIGVFSSEGRNYYFMDNVYANATYPTQDFQAILGNEKDFLSTRVSFKLNLTGPSITLQTACSSSLVAIQMACESLKTKGCDMALAGGVSIFYNLGYPYQEDMIESPDGYCRAFDANAKGTVVTSGVGILVLKRLSDAIQHNDTIYAVIKGGAVNNDGAAKMSFTAPSVKGQCAVIEKALQNANVSPETISYIEAHGTGTILGDPIEWSALHKVYEKYVDQPEFCTIGALKTNIGHTDSAAGVLGVIKTVLALKNKMLPATLNFKSLNTEIAAFNRLFRVLNYSSYWENKENPRRAAVSSFGIGGTNAHIILEEYQHPASENADTPGYFLIPFSAKNRISLFALTNKITSHLSHTTCKDLASYAFTAQLGRAEFKERGYLIAHNLDEKNSTLSASYLRDNAIPQSASLIFVLSQWEKTYFSQFKSLYDRNNLFKQAFNECADITNKLYHIDIKNAFSGSQDFYSDFNEKLVAFAIQYALLKILNHFDLKPDSFVLNALGHGVMDIINGKKSLENTLHDLHAVENDIPAITFDEKNLYVFLGKKLSNEATSSMQIEFFSRSNENAEINLLNLLGWLWSQGVNIKWESFSHTGKKIPIPTYSFTRKHYEIKKRLPTKNILNDSAIKVDTSIENQLKEMWAQVLGVTADEISASSHFLNLGGDSLSLIDLLNNIKKSLNINFHLDEIITQAEFGTMLNLVRQKYESLEY